jgi:succinate dehydrogenase / fumarate reductase membrane anchor subunit
MTLQSPLGRARGLGSARAGVQHWWLQRVSAVALVPLSLWLGASLLSLTGADYLTFTSWVMQPTNAILLLLAIGASSYHFKVGIDVVIEDYVHAGWIKMTARAFNLCFVLTTSAAAAFAVLKLAI